QRWTGVRLHRSRARKHCFETKFSCYPHAHTRGECETECPSPKRPWPWPLQTRESVRVARGREQPASSGRCRVVPVRAAEHVRWLKSAAALRIEKRLRTACRRIR